MRRIAFIRSAWLALMACAPLAQAQDVPDDRFAIAPQTTQDTAAPPPGLSAGNDVPTLGEVKALPPEEGEVIDLYRFRNPIQVDPNHFAKAYHPPPSPKEISEGGGYLFYGLGALVGLAAKALPKMPGVRGQIEPPTARPPPLSLEQMDRAARACGEDGEDCVDNAVAGAVHE